MEADQKLAPISSSQAHLKLVSTGEPSKEKHSGGWPVTKHLLTCLFLSETGNTKYGYGSSKSKLGNLKKKGWKYK